MYISQVVLLLDIVQCLFKALTKACNIFSYEQGNLAFILEYFYIVLIEK